MAVPSESDRSSEVPAPVGAPNTAAALIVEPDGSIRAADDCARALFGFDGALDSQGATRNLHDHVCEPSEMELAEHLASALGMGRDAPSDMLLQRVDGTQFWARVRSDVASSVEVPGAAHAIQVRLVFEPIDDPLSDMERLFASDPARVFEAPGTRRTRVLLVDDEIEALTTTLALLETLGVEAAGFSDPKLALEEFLSRSSEYDAVIVDHDMPPVSGLSFCRTLLEVRVELPILIASSAGHAFDATKAIGVGVDQVLEKPLDAEALAQWLRGVSSLF